MSAYKDRTGERYGTYIALADTGRMSGPFRIWRARCDCGVERELSSRTLSVGPKCSCMPHGAQTHGLTYTHRAEYRVWASMRARCQNPANDDYRHYGGRGIKICGRWDDFAAFVADMGPRAPGMTIERLDVNGDYAPGNCVWASRKVQANNKRTSRHLSVSGRTKTVSQWAEELGVSEATIRCRIDRLGWSIERALSNV